MGRKPRGNVTAAMALATAHAVRLLQDPETRAQLVRVGGDASRQIRSWYQDRNLGNRATEPLVGDVIDEDGNTVSPGADVVVTRGVRLRRPQSLFAQERLERRTVKLADTLDVLRNSLQGEPGDALDGVDEAIMRIHLALRVATNLPFAKRARAHHEIGQTLSSLETAVMEAVLRDGAAR